MTTTAQRLDQLDTEPRPEKVHPFPGNVLMHLSGFSEHDSCAPDQVGEVRTEVTDLDSAAVVTSLHDMPLPFALDDTAEWHRPVLDIDLPCTLLPSSTPGHHHLLIDSPLTWEQYSELLGVLANVGIIEQGYVDASRKRRHTAVRVPWLRKGDPLPLLPEQRAAVRASEIELAALSVLTAVGEHKLAAEERLRSLLGLPAPIMSDEPDW